MGVVNPKNIFISYGHKDASELALKLEKDLKNEGHNVWLDKSRMRDAEPWEDQIEVEILNREIFIALLTPYAVGRPDGVCRDEISMARFEHRKIIPIMVIKCTPPLCIYRLNYIDFQGWEIEHQYEKVFLRLKKLLEREAGAEGLYARVFSELKKLDFGSEIFKLTKDFTGRKWLFDELDEWLATKDNRVFLITGDPGIGKSAIIAYLVHNHPQVVACHFCDSDIKDSLDTNLFIRSIAAQLASQLENYRKALESINLEELISFGDPGTLMRRLIIDPLKGESQKNPMIIAVDALDETLVEQSLITQVLRSQLKYFPEWIKFVLSSRKEPKIIDSLSDYNPYEIEAVSPENIQDIESYLEEKLKQPKFKKIFAGKKVNKRSLIDVIANKGEGNFLYVKEALKGIKNGSIDPSHPDSFPVSLVGFYLSYFDRTFPNGQGYEEIRNFLEIIFASFIPLNAQQIGYIAGQDPLTLQKKLQKLAVYFPERFGYYKVYHKAFHDWLIGEVGTDKTYRVNNDNGHFIISDRLYQSYQDRNIPLFIKDYLLSFLPYHLLIQEKWHLLYLLLTDRHYIDSYLSVGDVYGLSDIYRDILFKRKKNLYSEKSIQVLKDKNISIDVFYGDSNSKIDDDSNAFNFLKVYLEHPYGIPRIDIPKPYKKEISKYWVKLLRKYPLANLGRNITRRDLKKELKY